MLTFVAVIVFAVAMALRLLVGIACGICGPFAILFGVRMLISGEGRGWWLIGGGVLAFALAGVLLPQSDETESSSGPGSSTGFGAGPG